VCCGLVATILAAIYPPCAPNAHRTLAIYGAGRDSAFQNNVSGKVATLCMSNSTRRSRIELFMLYCFRFSLRQVISFHLG